MYCATVATTCWLCLPAGCHDNACSTGDRGRSGDRSSSRRFRTDSESWISSMRSIPPPSVKLEKTTECFSLKCLTKAVKQQWFGWLQGAELRRKQHGCFQNLEKTADFGHLVFGALSPVNHKGLYQGWKQTSVYLLVIHSTSHYTISLFLSNHNSNYIHSLEHKLRKTIITHVLEPFYTSWVLNMGTCIHCL